MLSEMVDINMVERQFDKFCKRSVQKWIRKMFYKSKMTSINKFVEASSKSWMRNPQLLGRVITSGKTDFSEVLETNKQSKHWNSPSSSKVKKTRMSKSKVKMMFIFFLYILRPAAHGTKICCLFCQMRCSCCLWDNACICL